MGDNGTRVDIRRSRSNGDASGGSAGSHGRRRFPERLVDKNRRVGTTGVANVDNGASISPGLANVVAQKACQLESTLENTTTQQVAPPSLGQAGLIQAERLTHSPDNARPRQRRAVTGTDPERPNVDVPTAVPSNLRSSRFEAIPITCIHNVEDYVDENGVTWEFKRSKLTAVSVTGAMQEVNFSKARYTPRPEESVVLRPGDANDDAITWDYHDVTTAPKIANDASPLTQKVLSFQKVRDAFEFQVGQKIGMVVFRNFEVTPEDAGMAQNSITEHELRQVFGRAHVVNIYTGQIMNVSPDGNSFGHNINTFRGCSGAVIFLLDIGQEGFGVVESDYGKAIAVHAGGDRLSDGTIINFAFKIL